MTVLRNEGRWDSSNADFRDGVVAHYDKFSPTSDMRWIDYGLGGLTERALECADPDTSDLAVNFTTSWPEERAVWLMDDYTLF